ncbi:MAG: hypothetical protein ABH863_01570 [Candidatus Micrarchaeota archaeon]
MKFAGILLVALLFLYGCTSNTPSAPSPSTAMSTIPSIVDSVGPSLAPTPSSSSSPSIPAPSLEAYDKDKHEGALLSGYVIMLYFHSDACSDCIKQKTVIENALKEAAFRNVAAFAVKFISPQPNPDEEAIALVYGIASSGTILILGEGGAEKYRDSRTLTEPEVIAKLAGAGAK